MENKEIKALYSKVRLIEEQPQQVEELKRFLEPMLSAYTQDDRNKIVNSVAKALREEFGTIHDSIIKELELVRVVHPRTVQKAKKKEKEQNNINR